MERANLCTKAKAHLCTKAKARTQEVIKSFTPKSHQKQQMLVGGEERKNKEEHNKWNFKN